MSSGVVGMRTKMVRRWHWPAVRSTLEILRLGMLGRQVKTGVRQEPRRRYWRPSAVAGKVESRTRAWSLPRSIQGRYHSDSDTPWVFRGDTAAAAGQRVQSRTRDTMRSGSAADLNLNGDSLRISRAYICGPVITVGLRLGFGLWIVVYKLLQKVIKCASDTWLKLTNGQSRIKAHAN